MDKKTKLDLEQKRESFHIAQLLNDKQENLIVDIEKLEDIKKDYLDFVNSLILKGYSVPKCDITNAKRAYN